jgi:hypothetical protein
MRWKRGLESQNSYNFREPFILIFSPRNGGEEILDYLKDGKLN